MKKNILITAVIVLWIGTVGFGFSKFYDYQFKTGRESQVSSLWPTGSVIKKQNTYQLVMLAHPRCPCTRASIGELALIMAHAQGKVDAYVLFIQPKGVDEQWVKTDLYKKAGAIPGVQVIIDEEGKQAGLFGGTTSGQTFLYDEQGRLVFAGGITDSRGHSGDNVGRSTIAALIDHKPVDVRTTKFFGCSLKG